MRWLFVCVGKKSKHRLTAATDEWLSRLNRYIDVAVRYVTPPTGMLSPQDRRAKEAKRIQTELPPRRCLIVLDPSGIVCDSDRFSRLLTRWREAGRQPVFVIGGAYGLDQALLDAADTILSLSHLTFTHQTAKLVLVEQLYRGFCLLDGSPFPK